VSHFIEKYNDAHGKTVKGLAPGTLNALLSYDWPGNVRELGERRGARRGAGAGERADQRRSAGDAASGPARRIAAPTR
jgi:transcriptional regulator with GAF, ATPase, and Fis domain